MSNTATLGKAYVQILPSAEGIEGRLSNIIDPEAKKAGQKGGNSFATVFKQIIVAAGIGKAFQAVFTQGAELQQNLGGTEAVFGQFANNLQVAATSAYKNMGLSASEYMSTANKMGSLFQGSGIEQQKSLQMTSDAMQRAADVASVMGIDTKMAMESIAGAAKGNFTMMDNLGVAMNATTLQAYALEKGVNFKWNTATNAQKAELAMQMFMERTQQYQGNFARESEETLSGSLGAMKAVFNDFLGNLALGNDIKPSLEALAKTTVTFLLKNFIPMVVNVIKALPSAIATIGVELVNQMMIIGGQMMSGISSGIGSNLTSVYENIFKMIDGAKLFIENELPNFLEKGVTIITNIANGLLSNLPTMISSIGTIINGVVNCILNSYPIFLQAGWDLILNLLNGIILNAPSIISSIIDLMANLIGNIAQNLPQLYQKGIEIIGNVAAGLIRAVPDLIEKIPGILKQAAEAFMKFDWVKIGLDIIAGVVRGITNAAASIGNALLDAAKRAWDGVLNFFGIHSPATKGIFAGEMVLAGFAKGIINMIPNVKEAFGKFNDVSAISIEKDLAVAVRSGSNRTQSMTAVPTSVSPAGFSQNITINSPTALTPSEVARKTRNATRSMILTMNGKV